MAATARMYLGGVAFHRPDHGGRSGERYRDAGADEVALLMRGRPRGESEIVAAIEQMAREFVEPAQKL